MERAGVVLPGSRAEAFDLLCGAVAFLLGSRCCLDMIYDLLLLGYLWKALRAHIFGAFSCLTRWIFGVLFSSFFFPFFRGRGHLCILDLGDWISLW